MTRLVGDEGENAALWDSLERLDGMVRLPGVAERGVVLAVAAGEDEGRGAAPLVAVRESGEGRVVTIATDSLWRWRFSGPLLGGPADAYPALWRRCLDWMTRDPGLDRLKVDVTPPAPRPDEAVLVRVELKDESFRPTPHAKLTAEIGWADSSGVARSEQIPVSLDADGRFSREWTPRATGPHTVRVTAPQVPPATASFLVGSRDAELQQLDPDVAFLRGVSESSGGHHAADAIDLDLVAHAEIPTREILAREDSPLWNHPLAFALLFAALLGEWLLRRRAGLN
jgi:hypothetical protein